MLTNANQTGLTSEFSFGSESALLHMLTGQPNPRLGNGLLMVLSLPGNYQDRDLPKLSLDMNARELSEMTRVPFLGSWCPNPGYPQTLSNVSFFPNVCALPGLSSTLLMYYASKVKWAYEALAGKTYGRGSGGSAIARMMGFGRKRQ